MIHFRFGIIFRLFFLIIISSLSVVVMSNELISKLRRINADIVSATEECENPSNDPNYNNMVTLQSDGSVVFYYNIVNNGTEIMAQLIYHDIGWVSIGFAPNFMGLMIGSEAVIGVPGDLQGTNPGKYRMTDIALSGVTLMEDSSQTLMNASIIQNSSSTTLQFTKLLLEHGEIPISAEGVNTFLWAVGMTNKLGFHANTASFEIDLSKTCTSSSVKLGETLHVVSTAYWKAHGILAGFSWAVLTPLSIMCSWYRDYMKSTWMKLHMLLNIATCICTIIAIAVAIVAKKNQTHFQGPHEMFGILILVFVVLQVLVAIRRPPNVPDKQSHKRKLWEYAHKLVGYLLVIGCLWEVVSGLQLYNARYGATKIVPYIYYGWLIFLAIVIALLSVKYRVSQRSRSVT